MSNDDKTFEVFVNQGNDLTDGWSKPLTATQNRAKLKGLIAAKITDMEVDIPEDILARFAKMHWCFPSSVVSIENGHEDGHLDGHFEYHEEAKTWQVKIVWENQRRCTQRITLEEITTSVVNTFSEIISKIDRLLKQEPTPEEINKRMWDLVPAEGDTH